MMRIKFVIIEYLAWFVMHLLVVLMFADFFLRSGY